MKPKSLFVVIEGLDGSGKTSVSRYLTTLLSEELHGRVKLTFEPHDPSCGGLFIRQVLMKKITRFSPHVLPLAFAANRMDHCAREINPWLDEQEGSMVICDRYYLSSLVYQSSPQFPFESVMKLNEGARKPDVIFFLNVSNKTCYERMKVRNAPRELFENNLSETRNKFIKAIEFLRVRNNEHILEIDASGSVEEVAHQMLYELRRLDARFEKVQPQPTATKPTSNGQPPLTIQQAAKAWAMPDDATDAEQWIESKINQMEFQQQTALFLDYVQIQGIQVGKELPGSELSAYELSYPIPCDLAMRGVALLIPDQQRYDMMMKTASELPRMADFLLVFSPGPSAAVLSYYERDNIQFGKESKGAEALFPATRLVTAGDLAVAICEEVNRNSTVKAANL